MAVSCVLWEGHSYHGPMSCCVPEPSGDGTWEPDVVPSGGVFSYSIYFRLAVPPIRPFVTAELLRVCRRPPWLFYSIDLWLLLSMFGP